MVEHVLGDIINSIRIFNFHLSLVWAHFLDFVFNHILESVLHVLSEVEIVREIESTFTLNFINHVNKSLVFRIDRQRV